MKTALIYHPAYLEHDTGAHPENADRLREAMALLKQTGLREKLLLLEPEPASEAMLASVHTDAHI